MPRPESGFDCFLCARFIRNRPDYDAHHCIPNVGCRANMAHIRQSRPDSGLASKATFLILFPVFPFRRSLTDPRRPLSLGLSGPQVHEPSCKLLEHSTHRFSPDASGGIAFKAHRLVYHSILASRFKKERKMPAGPNWLMTCPTRSSLMNTMATFGFAGNSLCKFPLGKAYTLHP